ncbi:MAG: hypothetical protein OEM25_07930 [Gammaproteobacteria bacterium]|nr:hypothetical protein [Gammaproteobacteria bacterium]
MKDGQENRRSFRISESVYVKYEILTDLEFHEGIEHRKIRLGQDDGAQALLVDIEARLGEAMYMLKAESDHVGRCMTLLNDKLNVVMEQLPGLRQTKASLANSPPLKCDVGADGLVFPAQERLEVDTKLHLQFLLSADNRFVETFCRVVRLTDPPPGNDTEKLPHGIAVEFIGMKQAQREILIQHMFNRESETLRMRRLEIEANEM